MATNKTITICTQIKKKILSVSKVQQELQEIKQTPQGKETIDPAKGSIAIDTEMEIAILKKVITALKQHISSIENQKIKAQKLLIRLKEVQQKRNANKSWLSKLFKLPKFKKKLQERTFKQKIRKENEALKMEESNLQKNKKALADYQRKLETTGTATQQASTTHIDMETDKGIELVLNTFKTALTKNKHMADTILLASFFKTSGPLI